MRFQDDRLFVRGGGDQQDYLKEGVKTYLQT
jgi:hypothetical protein